MPKPGRDRAAIEQQINALREVFVPYDRVTAIQKDIGRLHRRDNGGSEGGVLTLFGDSRSGKTKILRSYKSQYPTVPLGLVDEEGDPADLMEVVLLRMPDTTTKNFLERLLARLSNLTTAQVNGQGTRQYDILEKIFDIAKKVGLRLILIEEAHQGIDNKKEKATNALAGVLKDLTNESRFSMVISGTPQTERLVQCSEELSGRVLYEHEMSALRWGIPAEREMFRQVLEALDEHLSEMVFGRLSGLTSEALARPLLEASLGHIGHAATLLELAALHALDDLLENRCRNLTLGHLKVAYASSPLRRRTPNAFGDASGAVGEPLENPMTRMTGRTRQSNRDVDFKR